MARSTIIDLNSVELNCYLLMISLDKCNGSCNVVDGLSTKICVPSQIKNENIKVFKIITKIYEAETLIKHTSCYCNHKFNGATCSSNQE